MGRNRKQLPAPLMTCAKCQEIKPMAEFRETRPGFYDSSCRDCRRAKTREYMRERNKRKPPRKIATTSDYDFVFNPNIKYG